MDDIVSENAELEEYLSLVRSKDSSLPNTVHAEPDPEHFHKTDHQLFSFPSKPLKEPPLSSKRCSDKWKRQICADFSDIRTYLARWDNIPFQERPDTEDLSEQITVNVDLAEGERVVVQDKAYHESNRKYALPPIGNEDSWFKLVHGCTEEEDITKTESGPFEVNLPPRISVLLQVTFFSFKLINSSTYSLINVFTHPPINSSTY